MLDEPIRSDPPSAQAAQAFPQFDNTYARLPNVFQVALAPTPVAQPRVIKLNRSLAAELGFDLAALSEADWAGVFGGNIVPPGAQPIAMAYAGHQFGYFAPRLGDGRAILLGEVVDSAGLRRDVQLKGAGRTPFSRRGDGRAALGPVLREYIVSEAFHALGLPTTRSLAAVTTGEDVHREIALPGAVLTRVAASHIRVGTFQYFAGQSDLEALRTLTDYSIGRHYPDCKQAERPALALLDAVIERQSALIAGWMSIGFIHGVMNTDNMAISGETIDFGPCAFVDAYDPAKVFSAIDQHGRYAYANQPRIGQWNCARLAEALLPLINADTEKALELAQSAIAAFPARYATHWLARMRQKLGMATEEEGDAALANALLDVMHAQGADFTLTFRALCDVAQSGDGNGVRALLAHPPALDDWLEQWQARLRRQPQPATEYAAAMRRVNPAVIPRNHRIEQAIGAAVTASNFTPFENMVEALARPYDDLPQFARYREPPRREEMVMQTFCGT